MLRLAVSVDLSDDVGLMNACPPYEPPYNTELACSLVENLAVSREILEVILDKADEASDENVICGIKKRILNNPNTPGDILDTVSDDMVYDDNLYAELASNVGISEELAMKLIQSKNSEVINELLMNPTLNVSGLWEIGKQINNLDPHSVYLLFKNRMVSEKFAGLLVDSIDDKDKRAMLVDDIVGEGNLSQMKMLELFDDVLNRGGCVRLLVKRCELLDANRLAVVGMSEIYDDDTKRCVAAHKNTPQWLKEFLFIIL